MKIFVLLSFFTFIISPAIASDSENICRITGEVKDVRAGEFSFRISREKSSLSSVKFTELLIKITKAERLKNIHYSDNYCTENIIGTEQAYGLCQNEDIVSGDIITANTGAWVDGPDCISEIEFIDK